MRQCVIVGINTTGKEKELTYNRQKIWLVAAYGKFETTVVKNVTLLNVR
jgi:hypothetical protein